MCTRLRRHSASRVRAASFRMTSRCGADAESDRLLDIAAHGHKASSDTVPDLCSVPQTSPGQRVRGFGGGGGGYGDKDASYSG